MRALINKFRTFKNSFIMRSFNCGSRDTSGVFKQNTGQNLIVRLMRITVYKNVLKNYESPELFFDYWHKDRWSNSTLFYILDKARNSDIIFKTNKLLNKWRLDSNLPEFIRRRIPYYILQEYHHWKTRFIPRVCNYCGSINPDDLIILLEQGWTFENSDKNYKKYLIPPPSFDLLIESGIKVRNYFESTVVRDFHPSPPVKFYSWHTCDSVKDPKYFVEESNRLNKTNVENYKKFLIDNDLMIKV